jgi:competence protein ComEA
LKEKLLEIWEKHQKLILVNGGTLIVIALVLGIVFEHNFSPQEKIVSDGFSLTQTSSSTITKSTNASQRKSPAAVDVYVDVKGAVKNPGMYQANPEMRVNDVIFMAGGFLDKADVKKINLAERLQDQMIIYVPIIGEPTEEIDAVAKTSGTKSSESENESKKVNLNSADETELQTLSGIGPAKASQIIAYREQNGSFSCVEDLTKVSGFGAKTLENLKDYITVE